MSVEDYGLRLAILPLEIHEAFLERLLHRAEEDGSLHDGGFVSLALGPVETRLLQPVTVQPLALAKI